MKRNLLISHLILCIVIFTATFAAPSGSVIDPKPVPAFTPHTFANTNTLKFLVMGDWGTGDEHQRMIAKAMNDKAASDGCNFAVLVGDNFYPTGVTDISDKQWETKWRKVYTGAALQVPFHVCLGNHDYIDNPQAEIDYSQHDPRWKMPARFYEFSEAVSATSRVDFFALDTTPIDKNMKDSINEQVAWLEKQLKASTAKWKIVFGHHPVYSNGVHGNTKTMMEYFKPLFEKYHVDLYLCGHDHDIQVLQPVNGVHYVVSGGGGGWRDVKWKENTIYAQTNLGFVWCALTDNTLEAQCLDRDGKVTFAYDINK